MFQGGFAFHHVRIHLTGIELSLCLFQWSLRAGLWVENVFSLFPVNSSPASCATCIGVKIGVRPLAGVCCLRAPIFLFRGHLCWGKENLSGFSSLFCQTSFSDKWVAYLLPFPPFVCSHWVWEQIVKLTIMCGVFPACVCMCVCMHKMARLFTKEALN